MLRHLFLLVCLSWGLAACTPPPLPPPAPNLERMVWLLSTTPGPLLGVDPQSNQIITGTTLDTAPWAAAPLGQDLWVAAGDRVYRLDAVAQTMMMSHTLTEGVALDVVAQAEAVWVAVSPTANTVPQTPPTQPAQLLRFDPTTNALMASIPLTVSHLEAIAADATGVWVTGMDVTASAPTNFQLFHIDPRTNQIATVVLLDFLPLDMVVGAGSVWLSAADSKFGPIVMRFEPATKAVTPVVVGGPPDRLALGAGALWVTERGTGRLFRVDPATNKVTATVTLPASTLSLAASPEGAWTVLYTGVTRYVSRVDLNTNEVVATLEVDGQVGKVVGR